MNSSGSSKSPVLLATHTLVYIDFSCGQTIGTAEIKENFTQTIRAEENRPGFFSDTLSECVTAFEWKTRLACKNSTELASKVKVENGIKFLFSLDATISDIKFNFNKV